MCTPLLCAGGAAGGRGSQSGAAPTGVGAVCTCRWRSCGCRRERFSEAGDAVPRGDLRATGGRQAHRTAPGQRAGEGGGIPGDRHVAAAQGRPGQSHGTGEIRRRLAPAGAAARRHSAAAGARGEAEIGGHRGGGEGGGRPGGEGRRDDRRAARRARHRRARRWARSRPSSSSAPAGPDDKTIFDHMRKDRAAAAGGGRRAADLAEGERLAAQHDRSNLSEQLRGARSHRDALGHGAVRGRQGHGVGQFAGAVPGEERGGRRRWAWRPEKVRVISRYVGGGFGGKTEADQAVEAARLAKITGQPVQVVYSRAEEFFLRPLPAGGGDEDPGRSGGRQDRAVGRAGVGAGEREAHPFYDIPHKRVTSAGGWQGGNPPGMNPFSVGAWRAPSVNSNTFARESHMDVLAAKAGSGPAGVPPEQSDACAHAARAGDGRAAIRMEGRARAQRAGLRHGVRHVFQRLQRHHGGSGGGPRHRRGAGEARGDGARCGAGGRIPTACGSRRRAA